MPNEISTHTTLPSYRLDEVPSKTAQRILERLPVDRFSEPYGPNLVALVLALAAEFDALERDLLDEVQRLRR